MITTVTELHTTHPTPAYAEVTDHTGRVRWSGDPTLDNGWKNYAICRGDNELVDRMYSDSPRVAQAAADEVCPFCPARNACLEAALYNAEPYGVWGGYPVNTPDFRDMIAERMAAATPLLEEAS